MDEREERFQKRLTLYSILTTAFFTVVAILITMGLTWSQFNPPIDNSQFNNSTIQAIHTFVSSVQEGGNKLVWNGTVLLIIAIPLFSIVILKETSKSKTKNDHFEKISSGELNAGKDIEFRSNNSEENKLQKSLENMQLQLQIEEIKLEITKLKNQLETEKLHKMKNKGKTRDVKR